MEDIRHNWTKEEVLAIYNLPISQYPPIAPPSIAIDAYYPGASAETVERVIKQQAKALDERGVVGMRRLCARQSRRLIERTPHRDLRLGDDFVPVWGDGSLVEVVGSCFDAIKVMADESIGSLRSFR